MNGSAKSHLEAVEEALKTVLEGHDGVLVRRFVDRLLAIVGALKAELGHENVDE